MYFYLCSYSLYIYQYRNLQSNGKYYLIENSIKQELLLEVEGQAILNHIAINVNIVELVDSTFIIVCGGLTNHAIKYLVDLRVFIDNNCIIFY
jgi:hypothetical protein